MPASRASDVAHGWTSSCRARLGFVLLVALMLGIPIPVGTAEELATDSSSVAIRRALRYLRVSQLDKPLDLVIGDLHVRDYPGNWPQYFRLRGSSGFGVRDVSPFMVAFIHHALTRILEEHRVPLGLTKGDVRAARAMRRRAVEFLSRFESAADAPDAGTFGFWPPDAYPDLPEPGLTRLLFLWLRGPILGGHRAPLNFRIFPSFLAVPSDADVTATTYAVLLDDATLDGGAGPSVSFHEFFVDWRDLGEVPRRLNPPWLPTASGAFLTWLTYRDHPFPPLPNDVDLIVNANVLFALGRNDRRHVAGVSEAVELINFATAQGLHRDLPGEITEYYPDNLAYHYSVSRAFHEGGLEALAPAVQILADDLETTAIERDDGTAYWDRGAPNLNTAFALITLLNAGRLTPLTDRAARYLIHEQKPLGGFAPAPFFIARTDGGPVFEFYSAAFTTAMALEALTRHALARVEVLGPSAP